MNLDRLAEEGEYRLFEFDPLTFIFLEIVINFFGGLLYPIREDINNAVAAAYPLTGPVGPDGTQYLIYSVDPNSPIVAQSYMHLMWFVLIIQLIVFVLMVLSQRRVRLLLKRIYLHWKVKRR